MKTVGKVKELLEAIATSKCIYRRLPQASAKKKKKNTKLPCIYDFRFFFFFQIWLLSFCLFSFYIPDNRFYITRPGSLWTDNQARSNMSGLVL